MCLRQQQKMLLFYNFTLSKQQKNHVNFKVKVGLKKTTL